MKFIGIIIVQTFAFLTLTSFHISTQMEIENSSSRAHRVLKDADGFILKPAIDTREKEFYEAIHRGHNPLRAFLIEYGGVKMVKLGGRDVPHIRLRSITENFSYPCVMHIQMGHQISEPIQEFLDYEDIRKQFLFTISRYEYEDLPAREFVTGSRVTNPEYIIKTLYHFVNGKLGLKYGLVDKILEHLTLIRLWFEAQTYYYNFDGTSILIAYDAEDLVAIKEDIKVCVKLIDFSYVTPSDKKDENYLQSLDELIQAFDNLDAPIVEHNYSLLP